MAIRYEKTGHTVVITMDRYEKRNALDAQHRKALVDAWFEFRDDRDAWVAVITGVQTAGCAGGDLAAQGRLAAAIRTGESTKEHESDGGAQFTLKGLEITKPIIAAVNGYCMAGGMELLGGTDIRIASTQAVFSVAEPRRGLMAGGGTTARLPRQLGWPAAMELLLVAGRVTAERALALGLVNEVVAPEELLATAHRWAAEICRNGPLAVQGTKKSALRGFAAASLEEAYAIEDTITKEVFATLDATEGPRAFLEKREPVWRAE